MSPHHEKETGAEGDPRIHVSVVIPAHNPDPGRLRQTLAALARQTLPVDRWECLLVDNASTRFPDPSSLDSASPTNLRIVFEPKLGLSEARACGLRYAGGALAVMVDDDNVLAADYLAKVVEIFDSHPQVGAAGGKCFASFEVQPPAWAREFHALLALRDLGDEALLSPADGAAPNAPLEYPLFAPQGAGMALRRPAWSAWLEARARGRLGATDRRGDELTSSGDNDLVLCALRAGWRAGYFPQLQLTHLIPKERLQADYLARLNRGIQKSWMQVLAHHDANPWPHLSRSSAQLRKLKAWFTYRAWSSPEARIRWHGACGHFEGRVPRSHT